MDADTTHEMDRFAPLMIFACAQDFPAFAAENNIPYKAVMGLYQGIIEDSFVVEMVSCLSVRAGGMLDEQEAVLLLTGQEPIYGGHRRVFQTAVTKDCFLSANGEYLGNWHKVPTAEALHCDAWTCYPKANLWYVAKMPETPLNTNQGSDWFHRAWEKKLARETPDAAD